MALAGWGQPAHLSPTKLVQIGMQSDRILLCCWWLCFILRFCARSLNISNGPQRDSNKFPVYKGKRGMHRGWFVNIYCTVWFICWCQWSSPWFISLCYAVLRYLYFVHLKRDCFLTVYILFADDMLIFFLVMQSVLVLCCGIREEMRWDCKASFIRGGIARLYEKQREAHETNVRFYIGISLFKDHICLLNSKVSLVVESHYTIGTPCQDHKWTLS